MASADTDDRIAAAELYAWAYDAIRRRRDDLAARVSRGDTRDQAREGRPILGVASDRCVPAARSPRARATAATVTAGSSSTPHRGTTSPLITASHNTGLQGDEVRSYDCDYVIVAGRFGGCSAVERTHPSLARLGSEIAG